MIKYISELTKEQLNGKKVLMRVDFNVAVDKNTNVITESFKIKSHKETISYLVGNGAKVMLVSHISDIDSFLPVTENIGEILGYTITLVPHSELSASAELFNACPILLLDNIRQDAGEKGNSPELASKLAKGFDLYISDAFAESHRDVTSMTGVSKLLPAYGGLLLKKEIENLSGAISAPAKGKTVVLGGVKISTKLPVIKNFLDKAENILVGGAIANNFFKASGINVGASIVDDTPVDVSDPKIKLPHDIVISADKTGKTNVQILPLGNLPPEQMILDIGPESADEFCKIIESSEMVIWNGTIGLAEAEIFANGTKKIADAVAKAKQSIVGGGDTLAALPDETQAKYTFVSTGGGAMLEFLSGKKLPGLEALGYYQ